MMRDPITALAAAAMATLIATAPASWAKAPSGAGARPHVRHGVVLLPRFHGGATSAPKDPGPGRLACPPDRLFDPLRRCSR